MSENFKDEFILKILVWKDDLTALDIRGYLREDNKITTSTTKVLCRLMAMKVTGFVDFEKIKGRNRKRWKITQKGKKYLEGLCWAY